MDTRPWLLRPPDLLSPSVSALTGLPFHRWPRSTSTRCLWLGVVGLYVFSAMPSDPRGHVDLVAFGEPDDGPLHILLPALDAAEALLLPLADDGIHGQHLHFEQFLDRLLD